MKAVLIGVDGATWDVIDELLQKGELSGFQRLMNSGVRARLRSIPSTYTSLVWPTISTGKYYDEMGMRPPVSARYSIDTLTLWDILEAHDHSIGLMNWHGSYPPREIDGFYVPGGQLNQGYTDTFPEDHNSVRILRKLRDQPREVNVSTALRAVVKYGLTPPSRQTLSAGLRLLRSSVFDDDIATTVYRSNLSGSILTDVFLKYLEKHQPDFSALYLNSPDIAAHKTWHHFEPELFPTEDSGDYGHVIPDSYRSTDRCIQRIMNSVTDDTAIFVISDHGTGPAGTGSDVLTPNPEEVVDFLDTDVEYIRIKNRLYLFCTDESQATTVQNRIDEITTGGTAVFKSERARPPTIELEVDQSVSLDGTVDDSDLEVSRFFLRNEFSNQWGTHTDHGIFLASGPGIKQGREIDDLHVTDVAPTILQYFDVPVGEDMSGSVRSEIFSGDLADAQPETVESHDNLPSATEFMVNRNMEEIDEEEIKDRLRDLGYR